VFTRPLYWSLYEPAESSPNLTTLFPYDLILSSHPRSGLSRSLIATIFRRKLCIYITYLKRISQG
jgi:hypothetical protein